MKFAILLTLALAGALLLAPSQALSGQIGRASWYGSESGNRTANGERFVPGGATAAHRTLPFGTRVKVTVLNTGRSCVVRINDRGPFTGGRIIDLAEGAARACGIKGAGVAKVRVSVIKPGAG